MDIYEFTIVASGIEVENDEWHNRFYEAGCSDALLTIQRGLFALHFDREACSFREAIIAACADVRSAGALVVRIEPDPLVSASDIAERAKITRQAVSLYVNGERGDGFPTPVACVSGSRPLWKWSEVAAWLQNVGKLDESVVEVARLFDRLNGIEWPTELTVSRLSQVSGVVQATERMWYTRRQIDNPKLRASQLQSPARHRHGFALRRPPLAKTMVQ